MPNYRVQTMSRAEVDLAIAWAAAEGWNPGLHDADSFVAADPEGFLLGELDGEPIASISVVRYGTGFGFLGLYIVKPGFRGRGYGLRLWNAGLEHLAGRTVGLDGVVAQQDNYRRSGFAFAYRDVRYQVQSPQERGTGARPRAPRIVPLAAIPFADVLAYDRGCFLEDRAAFLVSWVRPPRGFAFAAVERGRLAGYGVMRACRAGHKIGPLFADTPELAGELYEELVGAVTPGEAVYLDVPEANPAAVALARRHGMTVAFETARMYNGPAPKLPVERIFGVSTLELG